MTQATLRDDLQGYGIGAKLRAIRLRKRLGLVELGRQWKKRLAVSSINDRDAFLIVLDRDGVVRWLHHGPFDSARTRELARVWAEVHQ